MSALISRKLLFDSNNNHVALFLNYLLPLAYCAYHKIGANKDQIQTFIS